MRLALLVCILMNVLQFRGEAAEPPITAIAFAPDGTSIVAASQSGVHVFRWPDLEKQTTIKTQASNLHATVFSPSGRRLAVGGGNPSEEGVVEIFSWPDQKSVITIRQHDDSVMAICWRDDTHLFSASLDREIKLLELKRSEPKQGKTLRTLTGHSRSVTSLCLLNDGEILTSVGDDQSLRVWDATGKLMRSLSQHTKPIRAVALRPTRPESSSLPLVATAGTDRTIRFWQPTIGRMVRYIRLESEPLSIAWTLNGERICTSCVDGNVRVIDPIRVVVTETMPAIDGWAYAIAAHPADGSFAVAGVDGQIQRVLVSAPQKTKVSEQTQ